MQTLREIRRLLDGAGLRPQKQFGQSFLIDGNLLRKVVELAELSGGETVLEVGPGTGSLTEELLARAARVVAVEIDRGLCRLLERRLGEAGKLVLISGDVLAGKHAISPEVLAGCSPAADLVANLPYSIATPLLSECLAHSWRSSAGEGRPPCAFRRMTFTVQKEVGDRLAAEPGSGTYGPVSVLVALLGRICPGAIVPAEAFWPRPKVASRIVRIDFDADRADRLASVDVLSAVLALAFGQRRKQIGSIVRRKGSPFAPEALAAGMSAAGIAPSLRAERVAPGEYLALANALAPPRP